MKVVSLDRTRELEKQQVIEAWRLFFDKLMALMESDFEKVSFILILREPTPEGEYLENLFHFGLRSNDELLGFLKRAEFSYLAGNLE